MFALHSNLVLFKFYSFPNQTHAHCIFTFQSGSIQIFSSSPLVAQSKSFTFQSGSIQIMVKTIIDKFKKSLHSNLVLFKSIITLYKFCIIWLYIPPLCQVLDTYFFQISNPFSTSILTATPDFSRDYWWGRYKSSDRPLPLCLWFFALHLWKTLHNDRFVDVRYSSR